MTAQPQKNLIRVLLALTLLLSPLYVALAQSAEAKIRVSEFDVNGMKVLVKRRPGTPTVAAGLFFRGGVRNTTGENAGIEGFTLRGATEAGKAFSREKLRKLTASTGTVISAGSTYDFSVLSLTSTKQSFETSWQIFADIAINPAFSPEDVERVREVTIAGLRSRSDTPEGALDTLNDKIIYAGHPYTNSPVGTIETITKFKAADLAAYHKSLLQTSRMLLVVVGDVDPVVLQKQIEAAFGKLPRGDYKNSPLPPLNFEKPSVDITPRSLQTEYVKGVFAAPSIANPDYYAMRTAITILQSQVFQEVRVKRNLSYAPDAAIDEFSANTGEISVSSVNPNEAVQVMLAEIKKLKEGNIDHETIARMAGFFLTTYYLKQETNAAQAAELAQYELFGGGWRNSLDFLDRMRKVKPADVQAVANKYMKNLRFVVVGKPADIDRSIFLQN
jgi:predicted Zn-dependent peptidase